MPLDIILFAAIAVFFVWKLRQVLGIRHGDEQERPNPFTPKPDEPRSAHDTGPREMKVVDSEARDISERPIYTHPANSLAGGLAQIKILDSSFDEKRFITNARQAYTMIVEAFARGDKPTLKMLLKPEIYEAFVTEIEAREERGEVLSTTVSKINIAEISAARSDGKLAIVTVDFNSEQMSMTKNRQGEIIDGDNIRPIEVSEAWIFERDTRSTSPNWHLVGTRLR